MFVYNCDVGVLLSSDDEEYEFYSCVYDKKHGFYDENQIAFLDKDEAIAYAKQYVEEGVDGTYAVVTDQGDIYRGDVEDFDDGDIYNFSYKLEDVEFSCCKKDDKVEENFLKKED